MKFDKPSAALAAHRTMLEQHSSGDDEGWPQLLNIRDLSVTDLIFIRKMSGDSFIDRVNLLIEYGISCDHPMGHRKFNRTRRWFKCDVCETSVIFSNDMDPLSPPPSSPGGFPIAQSPERAVA